jgi:hypothetical protein
MWEIVTIKAALTKALQKTGLRLEDAEIVVVDV